MRIVRRALLALPALLLAASSLAAQGVTVKEEKPGLLKKAKVTADAAIAAAQVKVPKGVLKTAEIEEEDGALIFTLIFETAGKKGVDEVNVNAVTGKVLSVGHESEKTVSAEAAKEKKEKGEAAKAADKAKPAVKKP